MSAPTLFPKILVATDLGPSSRGALAVALAMAHADGSALIALTVSDVRPGGEHWLTPFFVEEADHYRTLVAREEEARRGLLAKELETVGDASTALVLARTGRAADTIIATAREHDVSLIVVGTRGRRGTVGSVAERIVRDAGRPVLVVPAIAGAAPESQEP